MDTFIPFQTEFSVIIHRKKETMGLVVVAGGPNKVPTFAGGPVSSL